MKVFLIAGEPSGDRLGAALMAGLKTLHPDIEFLGVGGVAMAAEGLSSRFPMSELSVMGIAEVAPKYSHLKRRIRETAEAVIKANPDVLITIDSPDFCLRVARIVKEEEIEGQTFGRDIPIVHYVAPSVWAWRPKRATKMARWVDHVLALLPFEPPYMQSAGMGCDFVGHPVVAETQADDAAAQTFREAHGIGDAPLLLVLPGSRKGEVLRLAERFGEVIAHAKRAKPDLQVVLPMAQGVEGLVREEVAKWSVAPILIPASAPDDKTAAFKAADVALAASGTVSLELAAAHTPMVIAYDMNWLSRFLIGRMLKIDTVTLVNLVSDTRAIPEFLGADCTPDRITPALLSVLDAPEVQNEAMRITMERLGRGGEAPGLRAARAVLHVVEDSAQATASRG
ncbi:lipid-A-disaccharide synthase [Aliiroseovarius halocynthiae]|uniref:Lipid-A-disaccharide synthase n=1 Tax=Aliiroseovarius halocynthiae TaxID=985055 RepID=A0A545SW91_9RHOB|nr:lipid-A-disaccharide synthase [Aliiroseovarius halocynthiae]TQV69235.1 lipid-A-disaccharide synthase [Aliiroseovarius halocynthiae]SMR72002.1 lipid-A-disaccharide synthase [Aliiroseovarius halocynthiae]